MRLKRPRVDVKRAIDVTAAGLSAVVLAPIAMTVAVAVRMKLGRPVIFKQTRPGLHGEPFEILKFRTMHHPDPEKGLVSNEDRLPPFGRLLRSTSLDELPSLLNIIKGDMSIVGPRPLRWEYLSRYSDEQALRHTVRPGLTGLAQVAGRNRLSWDDRLQLDIQYIRGRSLRLDLWILIQTLIKVVQRDGVAADGQATMSEFFGPHTIDGLSLRDLTEADLPTRVDWMRNPAIRSGITIEFWPDIAEMRHWFSRTTLDPTRVDLVAFDTSTNEIKAMLGLVDISNNAASLYIFVDPMGHSKGVGRKSMQLLFTEARSRGIQYLKLETKVGNRPAQKLYLSLGFSVTTEESTHDKLVMVKRFK